MTNQSGTVERRTYKIGRVVVGSLIAGLVLAILLVGFVVAGATENVISGAVLVAFGTGWGLLALFSIRWTDQPSNEALFRRQPNQRPQ